MEFPGRGIKPAGLFREVEKYWKDFRGRNFFEFWNFFFKMVRLDYSEEIDYSEWEIMKRKKFSRVLELLLENDAFRFREIDYGEREVMKRRLRLSVYVTIEKRSTFTHVNETMFSEGYFKKKKLRFFTKDASTHQIRIFNFRSINFTSWYYSSKNRRISLSLNITQYSNTISRNIIRDFLSTSRVCSPTYVTIEFVNSRQNTYIERTNSSNEE